MNSISPNSGRIQEPASPAGDPVPELTMGSEKYEFVIKKFSLNESYTSFVIAEGMKWRYAKEADELDCLDQDYERYT